MHVNADDDSQDEHAGIRRPFVEPRSEEGMHMAGNGNSRFAGLRDVCTRSQIRHWQNAGLVPDERERHGKRAYRVFAPETVDRIREIARLRALGLSCAVIKGYFEQTERRDAAQESGDRP
jgi:hypothetical protein